MVYNTKFHQKVNDLSPKNFVEQKGFLTGCLAFFEAMEKGGKSRNNARFF